MHRSNSLKWFSSWKNQDYAIFKDKELNDHRKNGFFQIIGLSKRCIWSKKKISKVGPRISRPINLINLINLKIFLKT